MRSSCCGKSPTSRKQSGVAVSLYPHKGCYAQRMEDVVRLAKKTDRPNVGVTFTFCHFLAVDDAKNLDRVLEMARPYLTMVTINGTSGYASGNLASWIQVLGEGTFDVGAVLKALRKLDYRGPIGIIAYGIKGDHREILSRSIQAWKKLSAEAAAEVIVGEAFRRWYRPLPKLRAGGVVLRAAGVSVMQNSPPARRSFPYPRSSVSRAWVPSPKTQDQVPVAKFSPRPSARTTGIEPATFGSTVNRRGGCNPQSYKTLTNHFAG